VPARLRFWLPAAALGLATIGAYGTAYYAIGVLIPVMSEQTGWSTGALSGGFSVGVLGQGAVALAAGRTFDRYGSRPVLVPALVVGAALLMAASFAQTSWQFVAAWGMGGAAVGGGLYYNVTMPVTARLYPDRRASAFSVLTLLGALASPIFYPIAGALMDAFDWRVTLRVLVLLMAICVAPAAALVRAPAASRPTNDDPAGAGTLAAALRRATVHRALIVVVFAACSSSALLLHQVAAMQGAGLSLAAASGFAGMRGAFQIPGRLLLNPLTARFGVRGSIALCYATATTAALALLVASGGGGATVLAFYFAAVGGMSLGLLSPLNGLFQAEVYGDARLGTLTGVSTVLGSVSAASGAWLAGVTVDVTGSYRPVLAVVIALQVLAVLALLWQRAATRVVASVEPARASAPGAGG